MNGRNFGMVYLFLDPNGSHFFMDNYGIQNFVATSISDVGMLSPVFDTLIQ